MRESGGKTGAVSPYFPLALLLVAALHAQADRIWSSELETHTRPSASVSQQQAAVLQSAVLQCSCNTQVASVRNANLLKWLLTCEVVEADLAAGYDAWPLVSTFHGTPLIQAAARLLWSYAVRPARAP